MICPYLGLKNDPSTSLSYTSILNYCNRAKPPYPPRLDYQEAYCLGNAHETCPVFFRRQLRPLPPEIRLPRSRPVWGANQWKMVLAVLLILVLAVIAWQVFARGLISTSSAGHKATIGNTSVPQSSLILPVLTSTPSKTTSPSPTTTPTPTPTATPTTSSTSTRHYLYPSITPTATSQSVEIVWTSTPVPTGTSEPTETPATPALTDTPIPTETPKTTYITIPTQTGTSTPTDTPTPSDTPTQ